MKFNLEKSLEILSRTPTVLENLLIGLSDEWLKNNEGPDTWSPYDIIGHLIHGEKTDWVVRAKIMLAESGSREFEPFDRFAQMNDDLNEPIEAKLSEFRRLREENLRELKALELSQKDYSKKGMHPDLGEANLQELLSTWTVHDLGHIAQISRVMAKQYKTEVGPWGAYLGILKR